MGDKHFRRAGSATAAATHPTGDAGGTGHASPCGTTLEASVRCRSGRKAAPEPGASAAGPQNEAWEGRVAERTLLEKIPHLRRYARALVGDRDRADDLVQDCLVQAISRMHLFRPGTDLRAWLFRILHNIHVSQVRRSRGAAKLGGGGGLERQSVAPPTQAESLLLKDLRRGLVRLPKEQRTTLLLIVLEGMPYEEVARVTGVAVGTVRTRLFRARESLRRYVVASDHRPRSRAPAPATHSPATLPRALSPAA